MSRDSRSIVPSGYLSARVPLRFSGESSSILVHPGSSRYSNNWKQVLTTQDRPLVSVPLRSKVNRTDLIWLRHSRNRTQHLKKGDSGEHRLCDNGQGFSRFGFDPARASRRFGCVWRFVSGAQVADLFGMFAHDQQCRGSGRSDPGCIPAGVPQAGKIPGRLGVFDVASPYRGQHGA